MVIKDPTTAPAQKRRIAPPAVKARTHLGKSNVQTKSGGGSTLKISDLQRVTSVTSDTGVEIFCTKRNIFHVYLIMKAPRDSPARSRAVASFADLQRSSRRDFRGKSIWTEFLRPMATIGFAPTRFRSSGREHGCGTYNWGIRGKRAHALFRQ